MNNNYQPSNRETPRYYGEFRRRVQRGELPVCRQISQEMNRIDALIDNPEIFYDARPVEGFIRFCEQEMTLTDGSAVNLLDTFKLWAEQLLGWYYYAEKTIYVPKETGHGGEFVDVLYLKRLISKQYLIVARGAAKSMYASFIQAYFLIVDGSTSHQITTAPTLRQAEEVLAPIRTAIIRAPGPLLKFLTEKTRVPMGLKRAGAQAMLQSTKVGIESHITASKLETRPMTIAKLQGLRPYISTIDEWLSVDTREDVVSAIEQGASKLPDYIILATSSEGTVRNGPGDDTKIELARILSGEYIDPHTSIFHYRLDDISEIADPDMWYKANPNIGLTIPYEAYHRDVERATQAPSARNDIVSKRFGIPMEGYTLFFTYEETIPHRRKTYSELYCTMGGDLSQGDDFCSFTFLFPLRGQRFGVKSINFITDKKLNSLKDSARIKYEQFRDEGSLIILDGTYLNMDEVYEVLSLEIEARGYLVQAVGYDPYGADAISKRWVADYGEYYVEPVRQGVRTESIPLGELKALSEERALIFDEEIMKYAMGNTMVLEDTNGNRKLYKRRYEAKIDPVSALMDAYVAYQRHLEVFE